MAVVRSEKITTTVVPLAKTRQVSQFLWTSAIFIVLVAIWTSMRAYSRHLRQITFSIQDGLYYVSVACYYGFVVAMYLLLFLGGAGYHMDELESRHVARLTQSMLAIQALYALSMCTVKWSILWMLKRIFVVNSFQVFVWAILGLQAAWMVMTILISLLMCRPVQKNWDPTSEGTCGNRIAGYTAVSAANVAIDTAMCVLPLPLVIRLQVKRPYKIVLCGIFGIGIVTIIFAIIRLLSLRSVDFDDFSYTVTTVMTWTCAENGIAILVAASPLLRPIFDKVFRGLLSTTEISGNQPPPESLQYLKSSSKPKINSRTRREFITVGDSAESLELGDMSTHARTEIRVTSKSLDNTSELRSLAKRSPELTQHGGIIVEKEISQTYAAS